VQSGAPVDLLKAIEPSPAKLGTAAAKAVEVWLRGGLVTTSYLHRRRVAPVEW
jgi:hypothetical protein